MSTNAGVGSGLGNLPTPVKIGGVILGAAVLLALAYLVFGNNPIVLGIVAVGIVLVAALLLAYRGALGWRNARKGNPLAQGLSGNVAAAPQGISEPARRARLDDLRRNFEQGVEKFHAAGKNLYSVPWYALVGEPGSGKTEAIRHCNVGFPPGLQDQLQGAGGTLNMNWWFTNYAVILDTAGRLMFEEIQPGTTNEWQEFLKLLKVNRPNCPINGMLLVIPVDTLIKDTAEQLDRKVSKIAKQLDQIQRTLGVRFPVFVIITKCDLLNGFREFFDDLNDPQLQHQIMGWSNPAALDERFDPAAVITHLDSVKERLIERRQNLLLDPVNTEDEQSRRLDQVDALYALPDSITKIAPRLRRYLETIFVAGEWSPKPLFLRGIYFTSSMTEGSALDAELAEALGVPVDSLPEGRVWRRDRAYFLRDLFIEKVFREKGLVTRAGNADKQLRRRNALVLACGFLAVAALFVMTWLGSRSLESRIGEQRDFWTNAAKNMEPREMQIITNRGTYYTDLIRVDEKQKRDVTLAGLFSENLPVVQAGVQIPVIFKPMALVSGDIDKKRRAAYRTLFESTVLRPVYEAARNKFNAMAPWNAHSTGALAQLMKLEFAKATGKPPTGAPSAHPQVDIDPLFGMVLSEEDYQQKFKHDEESLQKAADWLYTPESGGEGDWPPELLAPGTANSRDAIENGVNTLVAYWGNQLKGAAGGGAATQNAQAASDAKAAYDFLLKYAPPPPPEGALINGSYQVLLQARKKLEDAEKALGSPR